MKNYGINMQRFKDAYSRMEGGVWRGNNVNK